MKRPLEYAKPTTRFPRRTLRFYVPWLATAAAVCSDVALFLALRTNSALCYRLVDIVAGPVMLFVWLSRRLDLGRPVVVALILTPVLYASYVLWAARATRPLLTIVCAAVLHALGIAITLLLLR